jgi:lipopolysaccharide/colanic/teichoic acid biosynthesis glycosyltransferase
VSRAVDFIDKQVNRQVSLLAGTQKRKRVLFFFKRALDILAAFWGLFFFSPIFLFIAIRVKRESPGPVFYRGDRVGREGRLFKILKFRTMYETHDNHNGSKLTAKNDSRVTPFGAWLRETKLNELPQLWNVLVGEMSLVGPRPEDPQFVEQWPEEVKNEVLSVRPGMTSPASVTYRDEENLLAGSSVLDDYLRTILPEKLRLDQLYVRHHNFLGDLDTLFMTFVMLLPGLRTKKVKEDVLFHGPLVSFMRRYVSWFLIDMLVAFISISIVALLARISAPFNIGFGRMVGIAIALAFIMGLTNTLFGLKNISWRYASPTHVFDLGLSTLIGMLIFSMLVLPVLEIHLPVNILVLFGLITLGGFVTVRYRERLITGLASRWIRWRSQNSVMGERVLIIGAGDAGQLAIWLLEKSNLSPAFSVVGMVDDDYRKVGQRFNGYEVLGTTREIPEIVVKKSIGLIMFAITRVTSKEKDRILKTCQEMNVRLIMVPDLLKVVSDYITRQTREVIPADE